MELFQEQTIENSRNLFRFYHYLSPLLPNSDPEVMVAASKSFGKIARIGGKMLDDRVVDNEISNAIELLSSTDKAEQHRYAGVLILKELAHNSPVYLNPHISLIFDKILIPLRDSRVRLIVHVISSLLSFCRSILGKQQQSFSLSFFIYQNCRKLIPLNYHSSRNSSNKPYKASRPAKWKSYMDLSSRIESSFCMLAWSVDSLIVTICTFCLHPTRSLRQCETRFKTP
jgi:hypothetical protein